MPLILFLLHAIPPFYHTGYYFTIIIILPPATPFIATPPLALLFQAIIFFFFFPMSAIIIVTSTAPIIHYFRYYYCYYYSTLLLFAITILFSPSKPFDDVLQDEVFAGHTYWLFLPLSLPRHVACSITYAMPDARSILLLYICLPILPLVLPFFDYYAVHTRDVSPAY